MDRSGVIHKKRAGLSPAKKALAEFTNKEGRVGDMEDGIKNTDVIVGVSGPNMVTEASIKSMNERPIVFALANPVPEIVPTLEAR